MDTASSSQQAIKFDSCLGAPMRVITQADFRYEGICFHLDRQKKVLGLTDVRIYGSEVRETDNGEIFPLKTDYDTVLLLGSLIKGLEILSPEDFPSTSTLSDHFIIQYDNNFRRPSSTTSQGIDAMSNILSRLCALLRGISENKSESFWSAGFWAPLSSLSPPAPTLKELDELGPPSYLPGFEKSPGAICRPLNKKKVLTAADKGKQKISILGPCPKLYISAIQSLESDALSERQKTREQQQQPPQSPSDNEKDITLESLSGDSGAGRGEMLPSEETRTINDELGAYPRQPFARGSQGSRRGRGAVGSYRGGRSNSNGSRGRGRSYWAPREKQSASSSNCSFG